MTLNLITDRTQADAAFAAAHRDDPTPLKGAYNATDYNRVGTAVNYLSGLLFSLGYGSNPLLRENWAVNENMTYADAMHFLTVIRQVRDSLLTVEQTSPLPDDIHQLFDAGGHDHANNIERILFELNDAIERMQTTWFQLGEPQCGEV